MTAHLEWNDGGVDDADVAGAIDPELGVDDAALLPGHHGGGADGVEVGAVRVLDPGGPGIVASVGRDGVVAWRDLAGVVACKRLRRVELADIARDLGLGAAVELEHEVLGVDGGGYRRVAAADVDVTAREGQERPEFGRPLGATKVDEDFGEGDLGLEDEVVLQLEELEEVGRLGDVAVGGGDARGVGGQVGLNLLREACRLVAEQVADRGVCNESGLVCQGVVVRKAKVDPVVALVLHILTHCREVHDDVNSILSEDRRVSDTGELKQLGGTERAGRKDDLLRGLDGLGLSRKAGNRHTLGRGAARVVCGSPNQLVGSSVEQNLQVCGVLVRVIIGPCRILTDVELLVDVGREDAESYHAASVDVRVERKTHSAVGGGNVGDQGGVGLAVSPSGHEGSVVTMVIFFIAQMSSRLTLRAGGLEVLALEVVWKKAIPIPSFISNQFPSINLCGLGASISHALGCISRRRVYTGT